MKKKVYIGNLSFQTTETELKQLFAQSGPVETVRIITDRDTGRWFPGIPEAADSSGTETWLRMQARAERERESAKPLA